MRMRKVFVLLFLAMTGWAASPTVKIPQTRVRVLYDTQNPGRSVYSPRNPASEVPAEWVEVMIQAWDLIPWAKRDKPRRYEENKWRKTLDWWFYAQTPDGWLTIPEVSNVPFEKFEITIIPPGSGYAHCDCAVDDVMPVKGDFGCTLRDGTFPKFAALPEERRLLLAKLAAEQFQGGSLAFPQIYTYAEARWALQWYEINMHYWPALRNTAIWAGSPPEDPMYRAEYFQYVRGCLSYIQESLAGKPRREWDLPKDWKSMTDDEKKDIKARLSSMICKDLKEKKEAWKVPVLIIPKTVAAEPLFAEVKCEGLTWKVEEKPYPESGG